MAPFEIGYNRLKILLKVSNVPHHLFIAAGVGCQQRSQILHGLPRGGELGSFFCFVCEIPETKESLFEIRFNTHAQVFEDSTYMYWLCSASDIIIRSLFLTFCELTLLVRYSGILQYLTLFCEFLTCIVMSVKFIAKLMNRDHKHTACLVFEYLQNTFAKRFHSLIKYFFGLNLLHGHVICHYLLFIYQGLSFPFPLSLIHILSRPSPAIPAWPGHPRHPQATDECGDVQARHFHVFRFWCWSV